MFSLNSWLLQAIEFAHFEHRTMNQCTFTGAKEFL